jgi:hypothetical protein
MSTSATTVSWWPTLGTWVLVMIGWYAVHLASLVRERRKERREIATDAIEDLRTLEVAAMKFHTATTFDGLAADELIYQTNRAIQFLQRPPLRDLNLPLGRMVRLRKAITLKNADKSTFQAQVPGSQLLRDIRDTVDDMVVAVEAARDERWK